jgi:carboxymethylenebutenolidase
MQGLVTADVELGFFAHPESGVHPGVVMIHDVWGLADHPRDLAGRLAREGFGVLALDLYRRLPEVSIENPGAWMRDLSDPQVIGDVQAGVDFLAGHSATGGRSVGVTGFCMGGMYALLAACGCSGLSAAVPFYGLLSYEHGLLHDEAGLDPARKPRQPLDAVRDLTCPVLAFYGDVDEFVPLDDIRRLESELARSVQAGEVVVYPEAGHAFMNETRPEAFRPVVAKDAWARMVAFLGERLA